MSVIADWNSIDWAQVQTRIARLQHRIYKASRNNEIGKMHRLQKILTRSTYAKVLAVRRVTSDNQGKRTPGIDGITITSGSQKLELSERLGLSGKAMKIRRIFINKPGKKEKRPLGIPVIEDRANQALAKMALEPQWEALFEPNSYGFRPGRSAHDAVEAIFLTLRHNKVRYILDADIAKCFDTIDHEYLINKLNSYPEMSIQIRAWLKAGIMVRNEDKGYTLEFNTSGTPQGGIISPLLANIALHGLEKEVDSEFSRHCSKASVIRYADDFVIVHKDKETIETIKDFLSEWLRPIGLSLSTAKTRLALSTGGFNFLGFHFIHVGKNGKLKTRITPSKESCKKLIESFRNEAHVFKGAAAHVLITRLRPKILGWGNYFRYSECNKTFKSLDLKIYQILRPWIFSRHRNWGREKSMEKYFPKGKTWRFNDRLHNDRWIFSDKIVKPTGEIKAVFLPHISWINSNKHVKVKGDSSPYDGNNVYWSLRLSKYSGLKKNTLSLLKKQKGLCVRCNLQFTSEALLEIDHITPLSEGGKEVTSNIQLLHKHCHIEKTREDIKKFQKST